MKSIFLCTELADLNTEPYVLFIMWWPCRPPDRTLCHVDRTVICTMISYILHIFKYSTATLIMFCILCICYSLCSQYVKFSSTDSNSDVIELTNSCKTIATICTSKIKPSNCLHLNIQGRFMQVCSGFYLKMTYMQKKDSKTLLIRASYQWDSV